MDLEIFTMEELEEMNDMVQQTFKEVFKDVENKISGKLNKFKNSENYLAMYWSVMLSTNALVTSKTLSQAMEHFVIKSDAKMKALLGIHFDRIIENLIHMHNCEHSNLH